MNDKKRCNNRKRGSQSADQSRTILFQAWVGETRTVVRPGPPQIRTCAINASGSSSYGFAVGWSIVSKLDLPPSPAPAFAIRSFFVVRKPEALCLRPLSSQRFRVLSSPSLHRVLSGQFPCFFANMGFSEFLMSFSFEGLLCSPS